MTLRAGRSFSMHVNHCLAYRPLRLAALHGMAIIDTSLSEHCQQVTGSRIDPHTDWSWALARTTSGASGSAPPGVGRSCRRWWSPTLAVSRPLLTPVRGTGRATRLGRAPRRASDPTVL